jgi:tRNA (cmo5U34)-methyltransferase
LAEQLTLNQQVTGSIPVRLTIQSLPNQAPVVIHFSLCYIRQNKTVFKEEYETRYRLTNLSPARVPVFLITRGSGMSTFIQIFLRQSCFHFNFKGRYLNVTNSDNTKRQLEKMADFFNARVEDYEEHMLKEGFDEVYRRFAELIPAGTKKILDLGCGTGLELDEIFKRLPDIAVTGIDLAPAMLEKLKRKHPDRNLTLICGDYFRADLGNGIYDIVISNNTLHHFTREQKTGLYRNILRALKPSGLYLENDYMSKDQAEEDAFGAEWQRLRREQNIPDGEFYHFDIPFTVENQIDLLKQAGFNRVEFIFRYKSDAVIGAYK